MSNLRQEHNQSRASQRQEYSQKNSRSLNLDPLQLQRQINSLENQIQFTIANYEAILQTQKKNTNQRNQFLLYLIQSMKIKHNQQIESYRNQLQNVLQQKQQAHTLENQMKNIGEGVDSILQQGKRLKQTNQALLKQFSDQEAKQKEIDQQIETYNQQIETLRQQIDQWEKTKLKWNRKKKDMITLIDQTQRRVKHKQKNCPETGLQQENCQHCQHKEMNMLMNKYKVNLD